MFSSDGEWEAFLMGKRGIEVELTRQRKMSRLMQRFTELQRAVKWKQRD